MRMRLVIPAIFIMISVSWLSAGPRRANTRSGGNYASAHLSGVAIAALQKVDPERIRAHVKFLSDDLLEGRGTGQRGGDIAAKYMATQFELYGLKPAGDNGTYMQKVHLVGITSGPATTFSLVPDRGPALSLKPLDQYVAYDQTQQPQSDVNAQIVYVGYGIDAPEYKWDDYKGMDVTGKVLLMLVNEPPSEDPNFFEGKALTYYGRWTYKYEEAARKGAVGVILVHKEDMASYPWEVVRNSNSGEKSYLKIEGAPQLKVASWVQYDVAAKLAAMANLDLEKMIFDAKSPGFQPVALPVKLKAHMVSKLRNFDSNNVIAEIPGASSKLSGEAVLYTAHYDHLGIRPDMPGDNIYNGADDNATGCGTLLEIARAYSLAAQRPGRSILFAAVTAEEQGLLGSQYLGEHPPVPAGKISLALNFDDLPPLGEPQEVEVSGAERTTFYPTVEALAKEFRLAIRPDSNPGAGYYYRSDHFSLARVGIPAFSITEGMKYKGHDLAWGFQQAEDYTEHRYHQPGDEYRPDMNFIGDAAMARFGIALGWKAATEGPLIGWQKGDEFEKVRLKSWGEQ